MKEAGEFKVSQEEEELHRHRSECREWMRRRRLNGIQWLRDVLASIEKKRGKVAAERLKHDISEQWRRGNRGEPGDWRLP